jgi:hypothetical protein
MNGKLVIRAIVLTGLCGLFGLFATSVPAQVSVTPTVMQTPPGKLIVVNNGPSAEHTDPLVDGDLVSYSNSDGRRLIPGVSRFGQFLRFIG